MLPGKEKERYGFCGCAVFFEKFFWTFQWKKGKRAGRGDCAFYLIAEEKREEEGEEEENFMEKEEIFSSEKKQEALKYRGKIISGVK